MQEYLINPETGEEILTQIDESDLKGFSEICSKQCAYWMKLKPKDKEMKSLKKLKIKYWFKQLFNANLNIQINKYYNGGNKK